MGYVIAFLIGCLLGAFMMGIWFAVKYDFDPRDRSDH